MNDKQEKLLQVLGLKLGDKVKINCSGKNKIYEVTNSGGLWAKGDLYLKGEVVNCNIGVLVNQDFTKVKKLGEKECDEIDCAVCPFNYFLLCHENESDTLYEIAKRLKDELRISNRVYNALIEDLNECEDL